MSGFQAFGHLNSTLGFHMKTSKEQPPQHEHKIQGVYINTDSTHITIKPCQQRIQQITTTLQQAIDTNSLQPSLAQKLAGKCAFTATQLFGKVGRAANRALYDHAFSNHTHLDKPTRLGILAMINILQHAQPRVAPLVPDTFQPTIIYTDAYYQIDGVHKRCCDLTEEDLQHAHKDLPNGWWIVVFSPGKPPIVTSGHVPPNLLHQFTSSRAFIYFLEAWTAVIAPVLFQPILTKPYIQLCDNEASKHAILKGTGKHQPLNNIIGAHWTWHNRYQLHQILDRVPSKANIADPFSRGDFDIAHKHGWKILRTPHKEILQRTFKIIGDALFAHTTGFSNLSGLQAFHDMLWTWFLLLRSSTTGWTFDGTVQPRTFHELEDRKETFWRKSSSLSWTRNMTGNSRWSKTQLQERSVVNPTCERILEKECGCLLVRYVVSNTWSSRTEVDCWVAQNCAE